jgi:hypothetical protein
MTPKYILNAMAARPPRILAPNLGPTGLS